MTQPVKLIVSPGDTLADTLTRTKRLTYDTAVPATTARPIPSARTDLRSARRGPFSTAVGLLTLCSVVGAALAADGPGAPERSSALPGDSLYAVAMVPDGTRAFAVGAFGSVFGSRDGGRSWLTTPTETVEPLFDVAFGDALHGVIVGRSGTALTTADGGESWQVSATGTSKHLFAVAMIDATRGWAVGDWGVILGTRDGGRTWVDRSLDDDVVLASVAFGDSEHGWIVGEFGTVLVTSDGGATWERQSSGTEKTLFGVAALDANLAWVVGIDGLILRTRDGGVTWEVQRGAVGAEALEELAFQDLLSNPGLYDVAIAGENGCVVGDTGTVLVTTDRGRTWVPRTLSEDARLLWLRGAAMTSGGTGLMVGAKGLVVQVVAGELREPAVEAEYAARDLR
jgi:photosystem II stability/assembly factor-like uncharacterized protein